MLNRTFLLLCVVALLASPARADDLDRLISLVKAVGPRGAGHAEATSAIAKLEQTPAGELVRILAAFDDATPLAANWLRGAFEAAAASALQSPQGLPLSDLEAFVADRTHSSIARRCAYEWLVQGDPTAPDRIIPGMLDDPSAEMRRDAVARLLTEAQQAEEAGQPMQALALYQQALTGASDGDQVETLAQALAKLEQPVDLVQHFAIVTEWQVIGPFDNHELVGFAAVYPPETEIKLDAEYEGTMGPMNWTRLAAEPQPAVTDVNEVGKFDLAKLTAPHKGAVSYATTEFISTQDQPVEFRIATPNAWKLWVNGELVFGQEEYHRGMMFDQYAARGTLKQGRNRILLKICQNEQTQDWAQEWAFQFRVCDLAGKGVVSADNPATAAK
ncbi:MAG: hypothetical protein JNG89_18675 [Planctomycetaceae bacterium]|nr:hypothetical protein [Planctomycetaceae bacterium]